MVCGTLVLIVLFNHLTVCSLSDFAYSTAPHTTSQTREGVDFCHINDFSASSIHYSPIPIVGVEDVTGAVLLSFADIGQPFAVRNVTNGWKARERWTEQYFGTVFANFELFSSTFATNVSPIFDPLSSEKDVYYGIFINDQKLADSMAEDYIYPVFIPEKLKMQGNEWVHWGHPPCGAKRHMDLMRTSRISVQVRGSKHWRFYPPLNTLELEMSSLHNWTKVLCPLEVVLHEGDAIVWFPGWEHETRITCGLSVSLSLHFDTVMDSLYVQTFRTILKNKVSLQFDT